MGHESTDTKDTQDTTKSPQHTQQAHEFCSRPPSRLHPCQQLQPWQAVSFVSGNLSITDLPAGSIILNGNSLNSPARL